MVVVLTEQLEEPEDGRHDGHCWSHLHLHLLLLRNWLSWQGGGACYRGDGLALDQQGVTS